MAGGAEKGRAECYCGLGWSLGRRGSYVRWVWEWQVAGLFFSLGAWTMLL